jgi:hypothetical protein
LIAKKSNGLPIAVVDLTEEISIFAPTSGDFLTSIKKDYSPTTLGHRLCISGRIQRFSDAEMSLGKAVAKHRQPADELGLGRLVLEYVPMLGELAIFDAHDVGGDPGGGTAIAGEPAMRDHVVALGDNELVFVFQRVGQRADQVEKPVSAGRDVGAVLDVAVRPETLGGVAVALVEQRVEGFENECLSLLRCGLDRGRSPVDSR